MLVFNPLKAGVSPVLFELDFCCFLGEKRALNSNVWASFCAFNTCKYFIL